jgi:hypothetical protein
VRIGKTSAKQSVARCQANDLARSTIVAPSPRPSAIEIAIHAPFATGIEDELWAVLIEPQIAFWLGREFDGDQFENKNRMVRPSDQNS